MLNGTSLNLGHSMCNMPSGALRREIACEYIELQLPRLQMTLGPRC